MTSLQNARLGSPLAHRLEDPRGTVFATAQLIVGGAFRGCLLFGGSLPSCHPPWQGWLPAPPCPLDPGEARAVPLPSPCLSPPPHPSPRTAWTAAQRPLAQAGPT